MKLQQHITHNGILKSKLHNEIDRMLTFSLIFYACICFSASAKVTERRNNVQHWWIRAKKTSNRQWYTWHGTDVVILMAGVFWAGRRVKIYRKMKIKKGEEGERNPVRFPCFFRNCVRWFTLDYIVSIGAIGWKVWHIRGARQCAPHFTHFTVILRKCLSTSVVVA